MRLKIAQFFGGIILYSIFGALMIWISGVGFKGQWTFLSIWIVGMSLMHVLIIEPMRMKMAKRKAELQKKKQ
ncbi:hypothetical protein [Flavobacterium suzhouense]|uniref:2TM domain-containing protein n=1 Tax=Flavobacterium suzhouense TaxID=1529638 RepID=A0ABW5NT79_9FLAO